MKYKIYTILRTGIKNLFLILFVMLANIMFAQSSGSLMKVTGIVVDVKGMPVPGATVLQLGGAKKSTVTDIDGHFSLSMAENSLLLISSVGFVSQTVMVKNNKPLKIVLLEDLKVLDEVVVVGYGSVKKSDLTGSVGSVKMKDLQNVPLTSADQMLQGRVSGVFIGGGGGPGAPIDIQVRGTNSVNAGSQPLYVIDGVPLDMGDVGVSGTFYGASGNVNVLSTINPNDIASIEVLKDASATAIYGSRGSNGVVLITTKSGSKGNAKVELDYFTTQGWLSKKLDMMNADQYAQMHAENLIKSNRVGQYNPYFYGKDVDTDWQDAVTRVALSQNLQLRVSGGSDQIKYNVSANSQENEGIVKGSYLDKFVTRSNLEFQVSKKLKVGINLNLSNIKDAWASGVNQGVDVTKALLYSPTVPVQDSNGQWGEFGNVINTTNINQNMVAIQEASQLDRKTTLLTSNFFANYTILKGLDFRIQYGANSTSTHFKHYYPNGVWFGGMLGGLEQTNESYSKGYTLTNQLTYNKEFTKNHKLNVTGVYEVSESKSSSSETRIAGFFTDALGYDNVAVGSSANGWSSSAYQAQRLAYLGRVNYTLYSKYLFTLSGRYDGSSKFGADYKWGFFPSAAFAWKLGDEKIIKKLNVFSDLKLRSSYGLSGNDRIPNYLSQNYMNVTPVAKNGVLGAALLQGNMSNPDLRWEKTSQMDFGIDMGFFKNRLNFTVDYYKKNTTDLLLKSSPPMLTGYTTYWDNRGGMEIEGVELSISSKNIASKNFKWSTDFNISHDKGIVTNLGGLAPFYILGSSGAVSGAAATDIVAKVQEGAQLNNLYGYVVDGLLQPGYNEQYQYRHMTNGRSYGDFNYKDLNGDGKLNQDDITAIGNANPDFYFGLNNTMTYKNWSFNFFLQGMSGNDKYFLLNKQFNLNPVNNSFSDLWENRWTEYNQNNNSPTIGFNNLLSTWSLKDASYIRLQTVSLAYVLPLDKKIGINSMRFYLTGTNLYTWTNYPGYNPADSQADNLVKGFDAGGYPVAASVTFGISATF